MNYFDPKSAAERYAKGRPYFHPQVIKQIKEYLSLKEPVRHALDLGCGTGLSTRALREIAEEVVGLDLSTEMIAQAPKEAQITYAVSSAEEIPIGDNRFDLLTLSSVFHWLDRDRFFPEARRVLRPGGWLVLYDNYFYAQMEENPEFQTWNRDVYLWKYPTPPRNRAAFGAEEAKKQGFHFLATEQYQNTISFSVEGLADYLLTQSNMMAAVEGGQETLADVTIWLKEEIQPLFTLKGESLEQARFLFGGPIFYCKKPFYRGER